MKFLGYFKDNAIIQRGQPVLVRGFGGEGQVTCTLKGGEYAEVRTSSVTDGEWQVEFPAVENCKVQFTLSATCGGESVSANVRFGDVYLTMGQSNMSYSLLSSEDSADWLARAKNVEISLLNLCEPEYTSTEELVRPATPLRDLVREYEWTTGEGSLGYVSAISVQLAVLLAESKGVPVGVVHTAMGGTTAETFMRRESIEADAELKDFLIRSGRYHAVEGYNNAGIRNYTQTSGIWNEKHAPLLGLRFNGFVWYLGESAALNLECSEFFLKQMRIIIKDHRALFGDVPFVAIHIAPEYYPYGDKFGYLYVNEAIAMLDTEPNVVSVPIYDIEPRWNLCDGDLYFHPIHPVNKSPISQRVARVLLNENVKSGLYPTISSVLYEGGKAVCKINNVHGGMLAGRINGFTLAGEDGKYYAATAAVTAPDEITVESQHVKDPCRVTYAFMQYQDFCNARTVDGYPLMPFRSVREEVTDKYFFPPAFTVNGATEVYENCFGWAVGTCHKVPVWTNGVIYGSTPVELASGGEWLSVKASPQAKDLMIFGVSPSVCLAGHKKHLADYSYLCFTMKSSCDADFLGAVVRTSDGDVFRLNLMKGEENADRLKLSGEERVYCCSLKNGWNGSSAPVELTGQMMDGVCAVELLFTSPSPVTVYIKDACYVDAPPVGTDDGAEAVSVTAENEGGRANAQLMTN